MATKVGICSNAALLVGDIPIADLTDDTLPARLTLNLFDSVRDALLRAHPWSFAIKRVKLSPLATKPIFGYPFEFNTPSDMLRFVSLDNKHGLDFKLEGRKILANQPSINIIYVYRNEDVSTWPPDFIETVTYELAAKIAYPIANSDTLRQSLKQEAQYCLAVAKINNAIENPSPRLQTNPLLSARY
ncbi:hypothetical protein PT276_08135 [Orbaceae bacterium ESL0721]|nr:hypothetical protein [Orbaceae bacterium ESL0721]